jgi:hypothetical protein
MKTVEELQNLIEQLPSDELARFRAWFQGFDEALFDREIAEDAKSGKLDRLVDQAIEDHKKGGSREL